MPLPCLAFVAFSIFISCWQASPASVYALSAGPHINTLNLLLPPKTTHPVRYRLQGSGGCFTWTWDHHDVLMVEAEYNGTGDCSDSAVVMSIAPYSGRRATAVHATDSITGQVIRCEVFIDLISRVQIFHHSVKLDLEGLATLRIRAFDSEDNVFSSLVGLQFLWKLLPLVWSEDTPSHSLAHVPLKDTPLSDCGCICGDIDTQIELEQNGIGSDLYVVRGIGVGQERVIVNVLEPQLEDLGDEIVLTVAEAIYLEPPSPLYILTGTRVQYTLKTLRHNMPSVIQLPSPHHRWSLTNSSVADIDPFMGTTFGRSIGSTNVVVEDIRVAGHQQISSLHVVIPFSLLLYLTPLYSKGVGQHLSLKRESSTVSSDGPWYLVVGWDYVVQVMAFSFQSGSRPLFLTKDNDLRLFFGDCPYWKTITIPEDVMAEQGWHNGTLIKAVSEGTGRLVASLKYSKGVLDEDLSEALIVEQEVIVCSPVLILFENEERGNSLHLPWNPKNVQDYQLKAHGGCGTKGTDYRWASSDLSVATVSSLGVVHAKGLGKAVIRVTAVTNPMNTDEVMVEVSIPSSIAMVGGLPVEVEVGSHLPAAVTLRNPEGLHYSKCVTFNALVRWRIFGGANSFLQVNDTRAPGSFVSRSQPLMVPSWAVAPSTCARTYFAAVDPGRATVTASLSFHDWLKPTNPATNIVQDLEVSWAVSAYAPLTIVQAGDGKSYGGYNCGITQLEPSIGGYGSSQCQLNELLLVPGSSMKVMLQGGPERWRQGVDFIERYDIIATSPGGKATEEVQVTHLSSSGGRFYQISCSFIGNYTLIFYRGNSIGDDHPTPVVASVSLSLICNLPSAITLLVDEAGNPRDHIKASAQADRDPTRVHLAPITVVNGRTIRVAAVALDGTGNPFANASSLPLNWILTDCMGLTHWDISETSIQDSSWEQNLVLGDTAGQCFVRASAGFQFEEKLISSSLQMVIHDMLKQRAQLLTDAVQLQIVTSLRIEPKSLLLYHNFDAKASLAVLGGTSHIEAYSNDSKVSVVIEQPPTPRFVHLIVAARGLGTATITVRDVGLVTPASDSALVCVAEVAWVRMLLPEEASIQIGSTLTVKLQAGDSMGNMFSDSQFDFMDIRIHLQDEVLELVNNEGVQKPSGSRVSGFTFTIRGSSVGVTNLYVSVWPKLGREILSELRKVEVYAPLSIHPVGLVLAPGARYVVWVLGGPSLGAAIRFSSSNDTIAFIESTSGMLVANSPGNLSVHAQAYTHGGLLVCKASLEIRVNVPMAMTLNVRGGQLGVGREMSIFPTGTQEDLFSFFELCGDYKWSVGDEQVLTLRYPQDLEGKSDLNKLSDIGKLDSNEESTGNIRSSEYIERRIVDARFSVVALGRASGKTDVTVAFSCYFQSKMGDHNNPIFYTASDTIRVIPDLPLALGMQATWLLPPHFRTSSLLPQLSESVADNTAPGKRNIVYSLLHEGSRDTGGITLEGGHIKTSERNDLACVRARDRRTGRSEVAVCIKVSEVSQMMIADLESSFHVFEISVGAHQLYSVTLLDSIGTPFFEVGSTAMLVAETNRIDVVSVKVVSEDDDNYSTNATISVKGLRQGTALIRISQLGNPSVADYILVLVGAFITPRNPVLHIGGHVNFSVVGKGSSSSEQGHWSSSNEGVIRINEYTGEAVAVGSGAASVSFNSSRLMAYTSATVVQVSRITIKAPEELVTNVAYPEKGYHFLVKFSDPQGQDVGVIARDQEVAYNCRVNPPYLGKCSPARERDVGKFYCVFFPYPPERIFLTLERQVEEADLRMNVGDLKGQLPMKIIAEVPGTPAVGSVITSYAGGFTILDMPVELHLTPATNRTQLTIVGSAGGVEVSWTRRDVLDVKRISIESYATGVGGHAVYEVKVSDEEKPFAAKLIFSLPTTGQRVEVNVQYDARHHGTGALSGNIITVGIVTLVLIVLPLMICARLLDLPRPMQQETHANSIDSEPTAVSPVSTTRTNFVSDTLQTPQPVSLSRSPPQPYTDYVSKTIENTPYFRREGFRRFDPSRTY